MKNDGDKTWEKITQLKSYGGITWVALVVRSVSLVWLLYARLGVFTIWVKDTIWVKEYHLEGGILSLTWAENPTSYFMDTVLIY